MLDGLRASCEQFARGPGAAAVQTRTEFVAEARYPSQVWELEVPLPDGRFACGGDVERVREAFHRVHEEVFAVCDRSSPVEFAAWRARVRCRLRDQSGGRLLAAHAGAKPGAHRCAHFPPAGMIDVPVRLFDELVVGQPLEGPLIVESPVTTVVVDPGASVARAWSGGLLIRPFGGSG